MSDILKENFGAIYEAYHLNGKYDTLARFHLNSFNKFVNEDITQIIMGYNPIMIEEVKGDKKITGILIFTDIYFSPPFCIGKDQKKRPMYPNECKILNKTYYFYIHAHYTFEIKEKKGGEVEKSKFFIDSREKKEPLLLGKIPLMVKSELCSLYGLGPDQLQYVKEDRDERGCYFIASGNEYALIPQENKAENFIFKNIEVKDKKTHNMVWIQSKKSGQYDYPYYTMVDVMNPGPTIQIKITISKSKGAYIPFKLLFMFLGILSDQDIFNLICVNEDSVIQGIVREGLRSSPDIRTRREAILYIVNLYKKSNKYYVFSSSNEEEVIKNMIFEMNERQLLPHIGGEAEIKKKVLFLGQMIRSAIRLYLGYDEPVDRDNYGNKRILSPGILMGQLFKHTFDIFISGVKKDIKKELSTFDQSKDYSMIIVNNLKEKKINLAKNITTGKWPAGFTKREKEGISQLREVKSTMDILSYLVKIVTPVLDPNTTGIDIRALHPTHYGFLDPADTPDGANVGLIKHTTHLAIISEFVSPVSIFAFFDDPEYRGKFQVWKIEHLSANELGAFFDIYVNGSWTHCVSNGTIHEFLKDLLGKRRSGIISRYTSIVRNFEDRTVRVLTDAGRLLRPLLIVEGNKLKIGSEDFQALHDGSMGFDELLTGGLLEYVDIHESEYNCLIARVMKDLEEGGVDYTHCEIDESAILSINSLMTTWANYNQGPRVLFENTMRKQSIGLNMTNVAYCMYNTIMIMPYCQIPLVCTIGEKITGLDRHPYGVNLMIAIAPNDGYNGDDASSMNYDTIVSNDLMTVVNYKVYIDNLDGNDEVFLKPDPLKCRNYKHLYSYHAVGVDGMPILGATVEKGDILAGHVQFLTKTEKEGLKGAYEYVDRTIQYEENVPGVIEKWNLSEDENGAQILKIKIRLNRKLQQGDKAASTASQKGIVSLLTPGEELMYDKDGYSPDIIFNPHGITTRMTMSHLYEPIAGLIALATGQRIDATPFCRMTLDDLLGGLKKAGLDDFGERVFYDGKTGVPIKCKVYSGFIYYQRLKHMVQDKIFARGTGKVVALTKQPIHGRKKGGGLRIGNMERDTLVSHGAALTLKEFMFNKSDKFEEYVSSKSGYFCTGNPESGIFEDKGNDYGIEMDRVQLPWTSKMLQEYILGLGVSMRMNVEKAKL